MKINRKTDYLLTKEKGKKEGQVLVEIQKNNEMENRLKAYAEIMNRTER